MNKKTLAPVKKFWADNKFKIVTTVAITATTVAVLQNKGIGDLNNFLREHDLFDAYYLPEE